MKVFGMKALPGLAVCGLMLGGCRSYEQRAIDWAAEAQKEAPGEVRIATARDAVTVALVGNPEINALRLKHANSRRVAKQTGWWEDPEFDVDLTRILPSTSHPFLMGSSLTFTLPLSGVPGCEARAAELYAAADEAAVCAKEHELAFDVRAALIRLMALRERIRLLRAYGADKQILRALDTAEKLNQAGEVTAGDLASAKRRRHERLHRLRAAEREWVSEETAFVRVLGLMPGTKLVLPEADVHRHHEEMPALDPLALSKHVRVQSVLAKHDAAEAALETEIRRQYPDLKVGPAYSREDGMDRLGIVAGLTLPLWNRNRKGIAEAEGARDEARLEALNAWRDLVRDAAAARANLASLLDHPPAPNTEREKAEKLAENGELGVVDYLSVRDEIADLELEEAEWRRDVCLACDEVARLSVDE